MTKISLCDGVIIRRESFGGLAFNRKTHITLELDRSAFRILELLSALDDMSEIFKRLQDEFSGSITKANFMHVCFRLRDNRIIQYQAKDTLRTFLGDLEPWKRHNGLSTPEKIHLMVTNRCNVQCESCYVSRSPPKDIPLPLVRSLMRELGHAKVFQIALGGGEPLLHPHIQEIASLAVKNNIVPNLTTNGFLLTPDLAREFKHTLGKLQFSLNEVLDPDAIVEAHKDRWAGFNHGSAVAHDERLPFGVNLLVTRANIPFLSKIIERVTQQGSKGVTFLQPKPSLSSDWFKRNFLTQKDLTNLRGVLQGLKNQFPKLEFNIDCSLVELMSSIPPHQLMSRGIFGCTAGRRFLTIDQDGNVFPCSFLKEKEHFKGNIQNSSMETIWAQIQQNSNWNSQELILGCPVMTKGKHG